jgi:hypothetical protein
MQGLKIIKEVAVKIFPFLLKISKVGQKIEKMAIFSNFSVWGVCL